MIDVAGLREFVMLGYLSDDMLGRLVPITDLFFFNENEVIFSQGQRADRLYLLKRGKVLLEQRITDTLTVSMSAIKPGFSFGWSSMLENEHYSTQAICPQSCTILSFKAKELKRVMDEDHSLGFIISQRLLYVIKKRYDVRTRQFIKTIQSHPEISMLL